MAEPFLGEIKMFAGSFAPRGYFLCDGQLVAIDQYMALFALIGTTYGGDGVVTFQLPNFGGRLPTHWGQGPGLSNKTIAQIGGAESTALILAQLPAHNHAVVASTATGNASSPTNAVLAVSSTRGEAQYAAAATAVTTLHASSVSISGGNQPVSIMPPYLAVNFIIAVEGIFPSRN